MTTTSDDFARPECLIETDWLEQHLDDPQLRIFDCTVNIVPKAKYEQGKEPPYTVESGRAHFEEEHIPGAGFVDMLDDISDTTSKFPFMMPPAQQFADAMGKYGVDDSTRVVLYGTSAMMPEMWATRVWWMLRASGFDNAAILNGGWAKWKAEGRAISTASATYPPTRFNSRPRPELFVNRDDVLAAIGDSDICTINALFPEQHDGSGAMAYGRKGRVPGSVNVPAASLIDPDTHAYVSTGELRDKFNAVKVDDAKRIIAYCGGGISATSDAFILTLLGYDNVSVYDASMYEWSNDESLPMETG
jgi:thiosulfate/3-mercaptopyruvate sulfurtransferase